MNIVYVADRETRGGATVCLLNLVREMSQRGHACTVLLCVDSPLSAQIAALGGRPVVTGHGSFLQSRPDSALKALAKYPLRWAEYRAGFLRSIAAAERLVDFSEVDVIHSNVNRNDLGAELALRHGIPHVWHLREFSDLDFRCWSYRRDFVGYMQAHASAFIAISEAVSGHFAAKGLSPRKIEVIPDGIDLRPYDRVPERPAEDGLLRVAMVGGIGSAKGQELALAALAQMPPELRSRLRLTFYGHAPKSARRPLEAKVKSLGLSVCVHLAGQVDDIAEALYLSDAGLMCSRNEAFGLATVEYLAAGLPVVLPLSGANAEFFKRGAAGLPYEAGNAADLARCLCELVQSKAEYLRQARRNRDLAFCSFGSDANAEAVLCVYQKLIGGK